MTNNAIGYVHDGYLCLSKRGSMLGLSFSSHLLLANQLIALDGLRRMMLVLQTKDDRGVFYLIDLSKISAVSVNKSYHTLCADNSAIKSVNEFLKRIDLQFDYHAIREPDVLTFYDIQTNNLKELPDLERTANNWQVILSKLIIPGTTGKKTDK